MFVGECGRTIYLFTINLKIIKMMKLNPVKILKRDIKNKLNILYCTAHLSINIITIASRIVYIRILQISLIYRVKKEKSKEHPFQVYTHDFLSCSMNKIEKGMTSDQR